MTIYDDSDSDSEKHDSDSDKEEEDEEEPNVEEGEDDELDGGGDDDEVEVESDEDVISDEEDAPTTKVKVAEDKKKPVVLKYEDDDEEDESDDDENYLQKFDLEINTNYVSENHPECQIPNYDEISKLAVVTRDEHGTVIDPFHKTNPYLSKYERARILGQRAKQIESGSEPFINIPETVIDGHIIAEMELIQKRIPFIIRRPIPNGSFEYWHVKDLENIAF